MARAAPSCDRCTRLNSRGGVVRFVNRTRARRHRRRDGAAALLAWLIVVASCSTGSAPSPSTAATPGGPVATATPPATGPAVPSPPVGTGLNTRSATDAAVEDLIAAIGNPDTGSSSEAMTAFETALTAGDAARINTAADGVLRHLAHGRSTIAAVIGPDCDVFCPEWDEMFGDIAGAVETMRDAGITGAPSDVDAGRTRLQEALLDHFWQGLRGADADLYVMSLPDGRVVNASRMRWSTVPAAAFDGNEATAWTTGDAAAPQWIEVDLGAAATLRSVRLLTFQDVVGPSEHAVTACGADGIERDLARFTGRTVDREWLEYAAETPAEGIRIVRVTTRVTPSMIGWREIEVVTDGGAPPDPSGLTTSPVRCGTRNLASGATATGEPAEAGLDAALAIDGDETTGWSVGTGQMLKLVLPATAVVSEIRLLLGESTGPSAEYSVVATLPSNELFMVGRVSGSIEAGTWRSLVNPTPSFTFRELEVFVRGESPAARILEVQVLGVPVR